VAKTLEILARLEIEAGNQEEARRLCLRASEANEAVLANVLGFTSEKQRLDFQQELDPYSLLATIGNAQPLLRTILRNKGLVLDSLLEDRMFGEAAKDSQLREMGSQLRSAQQRLSQMDAAASKDTSPEAQQRRAAQKRQLDAQVESAEASLARHFAGHGFARRALAVTVEQVQQAIPKKSVLVEFIRYTHFLSKADKKEERYGAILLAEKGEPKWVNLGPAKEIQDQIHCFQDLMHGTSGEARLIRTLESLYDQVWAPLVAFLPPGTTTAIISPDAELNFLSWALLLDPSRQFLARRYSLRYVASGRDLLLANLKPVSKRRAGIFANPDYGASLDLGTTNRPVERPLRSGEVRGFRGLELSPLPGAEKEALLLESKSAKLGLGETVLRVGKSATKAELNALESPYVLHLATHGFLLPEWDSSGGQGTNGGASTRLQLKSSFNPMHFSGLALAGAQRTLEAWNNGQTVPPENDGIVTAEEVGGLNLRGTWLVVLSACDTGLGEARAGEGVLGLRRGFVQAGTRNLLLTLWPIDDELTAKIIMDFYDKATRTGDAPQALAKVQRDWLENLRKEKGLLEACHLAGPFILSFQGKAPQ
jgi:CHAT domain-containing protein